MGIFGNRVLILMNLCHTLSIEFLNSIVFFRKDRNVTITLNNNQIYHKNIKIFKLLFLHDSHKHQIIDCMSIGPHGNPILNLLLSPYNCKPYTFLFHTQEAQRARKRWEINTIRPRDSWLSRSRFN